MTTVIQLLSHIVNV